MFENSLNYSKHNKMHWGMDRIFLFISEVLKPEQPVPTTISFAEFLSKTKLNEPNLFAKSTNTSNLRLARMLSLLTLMILILVVVFYVCLVMVLSFKRYRAYEKYGTEGSAGETTVLVRDKSVKKRPVLKKRSTLQFLISNLTKRVSFNKNFCDCDEVIPFSVDDRFTEESSLAGDVDNHFDAVV